MGRPKKRSRIDSESESILDRDTADYAAERLARVAPDEYEAVRRGEKSINAAAVAAGIRPHRVPVRLDRVESIAATLRKYLTPEQRSTLARLLLEDE